MFIYRDVGAPGHGNKDVDVIITRYKRMYKPEMDKQLNTG